MKANYKFNNKTLNSNKSHPTNTRDQPGQTHVELAHHLFETFKHNHSFSILTKIHNHIQTHISKIHENPVQPTAERRRPLEATRILI